MVTFIETRLAIVRACIRGSTGANYHHWCRVERELLKALRAVAVVLVALMAFAAPASAQSRDLFEVKKLTCTVVTDVSTEWEKGRPYQKSKDSEAMNLVFEQIDVAAKSARMVGNNGTSALMVSTASGIPSFSPRALHLFEVTPVGYINVTTVFETEANFSGVRGFQTVHSRHVAVDIPTVSQFNGLCVPVEVGSEGSRPGFPR